VLGFQFSCQRQLPTSTLFSHYEAAASAVRLSSFSSAAAISIRHDISPDAAFAGRCRRIFTDFQSIFTPPLTPITLRLSFHAIADGFFRRLSADIAFEADAAADTLFEAAFFCQKRCFSLLAFSA